MTIYVIAEAGVNHNGSLERAKALIDAAQAAGADAVKFQTFRATEIVSRDAAKAAYQQQTTGASESQFEMLKRLELSVVDHVKLKQHASDCGIEFLSTPFDAVSLDFLVRELDMQTVKIPSGEITNAPFLLRIARTGCRIILSTGMATLADVEAALGVLAFGMLEAKSVPRGADSFAAAFASPAAQALLSKQVTLLHCTTEYPAPIGEINLRAMDTLHAAFGLPVGYSDHTAGIHVPVAAVARGAVVLEKHFTLDRELPGPDHRASLEPDELAAMIGAVRDIELALGSGIKIPSPSEMPNRAVARRSLTVSTDLRAGELLTEANLVCKRPGSGVSPMLYWDRLGKPATRNYVAEEQIDP
ncbi:MAG: N-acetylneuraminate synthase [Dechloromonas sp.]|nr:MAG: N-acetylneuraminate synthase [Dechloromonas sp.]